MTCDLIGIPARAGGGGVRVGAAWIRSGVPSYGAEAEPLPNGTGGVEEPTMIDKTTVGVTAEPEEVEAVLHNLCGYHLAERDPLFRYTVLTREQVLYDALVAAIKRERGRALSELVATGTTMTHAAQMTNLTSRQQVQRLIAIARAAEEAAAEVQAAANDLQVAANDFEERMAAVEATLDEVVSGI